MKSTTLNCKFTLLLQELYVCLFLPTCLKQVYFDLQDVTFRQIKLHRYKKSTKITEDSTGVEGDSVFIIDDTDI